MQKPLFIADKVHRTIIKERKQISPIKMAFSEHTPEMVLFKNLNPLRLEIQTNLGNHSANLFPRTHLHAILRVCIYSSTFCFSQIVLWIS